MSQRGEPSAWMANARHLNISRDSVAKMLAFSVPPGYRRKAAVKRPKLDAFIGIIDGWLEADREVHRKQHHTAERVFERRRAEHDFTGGYTIVKDGGRGPPSVRGQGRRYGSASGAGASCSCRWRIHRVMPRPTSARVSLVAPLVRVTMANGHHRGCRTEGAFLRHGRHWERRRRWTSDQWRHHWQLRATMATQHSDACYVRACPAATAEAWVDGHVHAFAFFGKVPALILYDNDRCLMVKILPDGTRQRAALFSGFLSHYLFRDRYGRPGKGNE